MLKPEGKFQIPEETAKVAKAAFPGGDIYLTLRDALGPIYEDKAFQELYPTHGQHFFLAGFHPLHSPKRRILRRK
jgi:transposase